MRCCPLYHSKPLFPGALLQVQIGDSGTLRDLHNKSTDGLLPLLQWLLGGCMCGCIVARGSSVICPGAICMVQRLTSVVQEETPLPDDEYKDNFDNSGKP